MAQATQRSFATGVQFQLGLLTVQADVVPVRTVNSGKKTALTQVCPECTDPTRPKQEYRCPNGHGPFAPGTLPKARELEDGTLRPLSLEEVDEINTASVEPGSMSLNVCPAAELEAATRPNEQCYRLRLGKKGAQAGAYVLLRALASDPDTALYGVCRLNGRVAPAPFRIQVWRNQLIMQSLIRPSDVAESDEIEGSVNEELMTMGRELVKKMSQPFNADLLTDERAAKLAALTKLVQDAAPAVAPKAAESPDLLALLAASLQAA